MRFFKKDYIKSVYFLPCMNYNYHERIAFNNVKIDFKNIFSTIIIRMKWQINNIISIISKINNNRTDVKFFF